MNVFILLLQLKTHEITSVLHPERLQSHGVIVGTPPEIVEQLGALVEASVQRVMLQWLELDDIDDLEAFARSVLSQL